MKVESNEIYAKTIDYEVEIDLMQIKNQQFWLFGLLEEVLGSGMASDVSRATVTGKKHAAVEPEPTDGMKRESTEEATAFASQKNGRKGQAGTKKQSQKHQMVRAQWYPLPLCECMWV